MSERQFVVRVTGFDALMGFMYAAVPFLKQTKTKY
jgi:hypothetical protein